MDINEALVILPARGGSKRIIKKNIKIINNYPMIYWPLAELKKKFKLDQIIVSTDDTEIKKVVEKIDIEVPFIRPDNLSGDFIGTMDVALHALNWYEDNISNVDYVLVVYPTAVLLDLKDIFNAFEILQNDDACEGVFSATNFPFPIQRALFANDDNYISMFEPKHYSTRSQDLVEAFHDAGQFYLYRTSAVRSLSNITNSKMKVIKLNRNKVIDIDTPEDFEVAEKALKIFKSSNSLF